MVKATVRDGVGLARLMVLQLRKTRPQNNVSRTRSSTSRSETKVCFELIPAKNTTVPAEDKPQFYSALVDVVGLQVNGELDRRTVLFLVPPKDPGVH
jgi:hypothetical protein